MIVEEVWPPFINQPGRRNDDTYSWLLDAADIVVEECDDRALCVRIVMSARTMPGEIGEMKISWVLNAY